MACKISTNSIISSLSASSVAINLSPHLNSSIKFSFTYYFLLLILLIAFFGGLGYKRLSLFSYIANFHSRNVLQKADPMSASQIILDGSLHDLALFREVSRVETLYFHFYFFISCINKELPIKTPAATADPNLHLQHVARPIACINKKFARISFYSSF